ncbi:MAG: LD-carboxypeptidase [Jaaginema sp. PMC 1079.18]|nr:LD-carboxypeptidase [Jaaginema sp. PMC 1080.18]MEC4849498.1 LD-carboxypeptidase [Jaaginema sp. PMC 1079.18]MEC4865623.1 LD-carboxypeptidase [Jaaginema sp. PMC 1078.18]
MQQSPLKLPQPLKTGDLLVVIAPSGTLREFEKFEEGVKIWRDRGYKVELHPQYNGREGYLAGKDRDRLSALIDAWHNPECKGILCARGGYGSARLLENWAWPRQMPGKWLIGFSDITALLWSLADAGITGLHAPLLTTLPDEPQWSRDCLFNAVERHQWTTLQGNGWGGKTVTGRLFPANLTVATHVLGTPFQPDLNGAILALEDVGEAPYRLDRMLTHWRALGIFKQVQGIALGRFSQCYAPPNIPSWTAEEVLRDRLSDLNLPIVADLPFGHDGENATLPVGQIVTLDGETGKLSWSN